MPQPKTPEQQKPYQGKPGSQTDNKARRAQQQANNELLIKGILCTLIGLGVLVTPYFVTSPGMQNIVSQSGLVGWFALVLGLAFSGLYLRRRLALNKSKP